MSYINLHQIELYQKFCEGATHGINVGNVQKDNFILTKFIYAMIIFNIIYENLYKKYPLTIYRAYAKIK